MNLKQNESLRTTGALGLSITKSPPSLKTHHRRSSSLISPLFSIEAAASNYCVCQKSKIGDATGAQVRLWPFFLSLFPFSSGPKPYYRPPTLSKIERKRDALFFPIRSSLLFLTPARNLVWSNVFAPSFDVDTLKPVVRGLANGQTGEESKDVFTKGWEMRLCF